MRYRQHRAGVPVLGGELIVHLDRRGAVISVSGEALPSADDVATTPRLPAAAAASIAAYWLAREAGHPPGSGAQDARTRGQGLVIVDPRLLGSDGPPVPRLAWAVDARLDAPSANDPDHATPLHHLVLVDGMDGKVLAAPSRIAAAIERTICDFKNVRRKDFRCRAGEVVRGEGDPASGRQQVDLLYRLLPRLWAFWRDQFGRDGLDGNGQGFVATVRYCLPTWCPMHNAFWEWGPQQAAFGDGWADVDDFVGHEYAHGVLDHEARLFFDFQSGALNESFADIFGEAFDLLDDWGDDRASARWLLGEDLRGGAVRDMRDPGRFGDPDRVRSTRWYTGTSDHGGSHSNSGIGNKAATLIADGGTFNGYTVRGIGLIPMLRIEYEAMTSRLTSASDYLDLHAALPQACIDLVGSFGITMSDCRSVRDAVDATEMDRLPLSWGPRQAPTCPAGRYPVDAFFDDLERPADGLWRATRLNDGPDPWRYPPNPNRDPDWDGTWASSGRYNLFGDDLAKVTDAVMAMTTGVVVPNGGYLRFEHGFRFDASSRPWDGGVVEISADGGPWRDLGSDFVNSGYSGTIASGRGNPLAGRRAFVGASRGWGASRVSLADFAGQRVRIRFRVASDRSHGAEGWYIDDVRIYRCARDGAPPTGSVRIGVGDPFTRQPTQALSITGADQVTAVTTMRVSNRGALRNGLLRDGVELPFRATLDWLLTDPAWGGSERDGTKRVFVQLRDQAGNWSEPFRDRVVLDTLAPDVQAPEVRFPVGATIAAQEPRIPFRIMFVATDATSGVARTGLEHRRGDGEWAVVELPGATDTAVTVRVPDDAAVGWRYGARARDVAGSWSDLVVSGPRKVVTIQDGARAWTWTGDWTSRDQAGAFGVSIRTADATGASGTVPVSGRHVALVASRGPALGIARILLDDAAVGTVDLYAADPAARTIVWSDVLTKGDHTLRIEVTGQRNVASGGDRVVVDAVLQLR